MSDTTTLADALRTAADLLGEHPDLPTPYVTSSSGRVELNWYLMNGGHSLAEQRTTAQRIIRALGGKWEKIGDLYTNFTFDQWRGNVRFFVQVTREAVCERVVTGVETVTIPAVEAQPERTEEREVVEWRCEPVLAEVAS